MKIHNEKYNTSDAGEVCWFHEKLYFGDDRFFFFKDFPFGLSTVSGPADINRDFDSS